MIGISIQELLVANADLIALVPEASMFPYAATEGTFLPLIIYKINSLTPGYDKDGWAGDICGFSVVSYSNDYATLQDIIAEVRVALDCKTHTNLGRITLTGMSEGYILDADVFRNELTFSVSVVGY